MEKTAEHTRPIPPPRDNLKVGGRVATPIKTTNRADFVELKNGCPAEKALRSGLKNAKHRDGHYFFANKGRHESSKIKSRRSKSSGSTKK